MPHLQHDARVIFRLAPSTPVTWAAQDQIRIGGVVRALNVPDTQLTRDLIEELRKGATREFLQLVAQAHPDTRSSTQPTANNLVEQLLTVCDVVAPEHSRRAHIVVRAPHTATRFGRAVAAEFARHGHQVLFTRTEAAVSPSCDLVVEITERVLSPRRYLPLMSDDIPHLVIARDNDGVILGPLVLPGTTPCMRCDDLQHLAADGTWIATATQLHEIAAPHPLRELEWLAAITAGVSLQQFLAGVPPAPGEAFAFRRERITATRRDATTVSFHTGCGCQAPPEIGWEPTVSSKTGANAASRG